MIKLIFVHVHQSFENWNTPLSHHLLSTRTSFLNVRLPLTITEVLPRNKKQVSNMQAKGRQKLRLSHDALYNVHELAFDLDNFIHKINTFPDLVIVCGLKVMLRKINRIIQLHHNPPILFSYDTTFQLGNFFISPLLFRNSVFESCPVMPVMFLIHEGKLRNSPQELMKILATELPCLAHGKHQYPIVTDDEKSFLGAIDQYLPQCARFFCWNHIINSAKLWLRHHGAVPAEVPVYVSHLRDLFNNKSENEYRSQLEVLKLEWSQAFVDYYGKEVHDKVSIIVNFLFHILDKFQVIRNVGRWHLEKLFIYNPISGITTKQSEGFNTLLKHLQEWKEIPVDMSALSLYHLQAYYSNELERGLAGIIMINLISIQYTSRTGRVQISEPLFTVIKNT